MVIFDLLDTAFLDRIRRLQIDIMAVVVHQITFHTENQLDIRFFSYIKAERKSLYNAMICDGKSFMPPFLSLSPTKSSIGVTPSILLILYDNAARHV